MELPTTARTRTANHGIATTAATTSTSDVAARAGGHNGAPAVTTAADSGLGATELTAALGAAAVATNGADTTAGIAAAEGVPRLRRQPDGKRLPALPTHMRSNAMQQPARAAGTGFFLRVPRRGVPMPNDLSGGGRGERSPASGAGGRGRLVDGLADAVARLHGGVRDG